MKTYAEAVISGAPQTGMMLIQRQISNLEEMLKEMKRMLVNKNGKRGDSYVQQIGTCGKRPKERLTKYREVKRQ